MGSLRWSAIFMPVLVLVESALAEELGKEYLARIALENGVTPTRDQIALSSLV